MGWTTVACASLVLVGLDPPEESGRPRDVTLATRADPEALARLERPGRVLFEDDFEDQGSLEGYFDRRGAEQGLIQIDTSDGLARRGRGAIRFLAPDRAGEPSGSGISGWLGAEGHECLHYRRYLRFAEDYDQGDLHHTGGGLAAIAGAGKWEEMGKAGVRPRGDDRFTCGLETWRDWGRVNAPGHFVLYAYWVDMLPGRDGAWWGNLLEPAPEERIVPQRGRWICLEQRIQVNRIGRADGELSVWVDGRLYLHLVGIRWRTDERVLLKRFDLGIYVHRARRANLVWYDDLVISTGYVGP
jgi:hypothetical protein